MSGYWTHYNTVMLTCLLINTYCVKVVKFKTISGDKNILLQIFKLPDHTETFVVVLSGLTSHYAH